MAHYNIVLLTYLLTLVLSWNSYTVEMERSPEQADHPSRFFRDSPGLGHCPGIQNVVFGTPKCPGLAPDVPGGTELNPHINCIVSFGRF